MIAQLKKIIVNGFFQSNISNIFQNITEETKSKSEVGEVLNADTTFAESDKSYAPKDVGEDSQTFYDVDEGDAGDINMQFNYSHYSLPYSCTYCTTLKNKTLLQSHAM